MDPPTVDADEVADLGRVVAIFYAEWCPYCQAFLESLSKAQIDADVVKVDISDPEDPTWDDHAIETVPTAVRFADGDEVDRVEAEPGIGLTMARFEKFLEAAP